MVEAALCLTYHIMKMFEFIFLWLDASHIRCNIFYYLGLVYIRSTYMTWKVILGPLRVMVVFWPSYMNGARRKWRKSPPAVALFTKVVPAPQAHVYICPRASKLHMTEILQRNAPRKRRKKFPAVALFSKVVPAPPQFVACGVAMVTDLLLYLQSNHRM